MKKTLAFLSLFGCAHTGADAVPSAPAEAPAAAAEAEHAFIFRGFAVSDQPSGNDTHEALIDFEHKHCMLIDFDGLRSFKAEGTCSQVDRDNRWTILMFQGNVTEFDLHGEPAPGEPAALSTQLRFTLASRLNDEERAAWLDTWKQTATAAATDAGAGGPTAMPNLDGALLLEWESPYGPSPSRAYRALDAAP